jgi:hypothetical protein
MTIVNPTLSSMHGTMSARKAIMKKFHPPLPEQAFAKPRAKADRSRYDQIAVWAAEMAGTEFDLDPGLEATGIEHLTRESGCE